MKCPYCNQTLPDRATICPHCGETIDWSAQRHNQAPSWRERHRWLASWISMALAILLTATAATMIYYFVKDYQLRREYTRGDLTPEISEITLSDG